MERTGVFLCMLACASAFMMEEYLRERRNVEQLELHVRDLSERSAEPYPESLHLEVRSPDGETETLVVKRNPHFNDNVAVETSENGVRKRHVTAPLNVAEYVSKRAALHVNAELEGERYKRSFTGFLYKRSGTYLVERDVDGSSRAAKIDTPPIDEIRNMTGYRMHDAIKPPYKPDRQAFRRNKRFKKGKKLHPDILMVLDYSVYVKMSAKFRQLPKQQRDQATLQRIKEYYGVVWAAVVQKYQQVNYRGMTITPRIGQILVIKSARDDREILGDTKSGSTINANSALQNEAHWFQREKNNKKYLDLDHCMVFTHNQMYSIEGSGKKSFGVVGLAYVGQVCQYWQSSIIEDDFSLRAISTAAHELAHNLGAPHDNEARCQGAYQMSPYVTDGNDNNFHNQYKFSDCSLEAFYADMQDLNKYQENCMTEGPRLEDDVYYMQNVVPGEQFTLDQQCQMFTGKKNSKYCGPTEGSCRKLKCQTGNSYCYSSTTRHALHGTSCGNGKICKNGRCQRA